MKRIINWTFGSFFRTIGRIVAFLVIGSIIGILLYKSNFDFGDLFFMQVKADVVIPQWLENTDSPYLADYFDCSSSSNCSRISDMEIRELSVNDVYVRNFANNTKSITIGKNGIIIRTQPASRLNVGYLYSASIYVCTSQDLTNVTSSVYPSYYNSPALNENVYESNANSTISGVPGDGTQEWNSCYIFSSILSPGVNGTFLNLRLKSSTPVSGYFSIVGFKVEPLGLYTTTIEQSVDKAVQNSGFATSESVEDVQNSVDVVKEEVNKTNDTINDDDVTEVNDTASGFFDSFTDTDHGGISSIVTAPLRLINSMLSQTCAPLTASYKGKDVSLACGTDFWSKMSAIKSFLNVVLDGLLCYQIIRKLYLLIEKIKNPDEDRVEVMDL